MKFLKIFAIILGIAGLTACSDSDKPDYNSKGGVTVSMENAEMSFLENKGYVKVPFEVKGERNGYITVTCTVKEYGPNVAMEDVHYLLTSQTVNVDTMDTSGYFEIKLVDDTEENEPREFVLTLVSAEGATISGIESTIVTLKDNDSDPYMKMGGEWFVPCLDANGNATTLTVKINIFEEGEEDYYKAYTISGLLADADEPCEIKADFHYNNSTRVGQISISYDQELPSLTTSAYGVGTGFLGYITGDGYIGNSGEAVFTWDENASEMLLESWAGQDDYPGMGAEFTYFLHFNAGYMFYDQVTDVKGFYRVAP